MMTPVWVQAFFVMASILMALSLIVSLRRRGWVTLFGRIGRDEKPALYWLGITMGAMVFLMFLGLAIGSVSQSLFR